MTDRSLVEDVIVECPSCGEAVAIGVDTTAAAEQSYYEDCPVCCRPMEIYVQCRPGQVLGVSVTAD